jgi:hypothetical protein
MIASATVLVTAGPVVSDRVFNDVGKNLPAAVGQPR